jgi:hypothetical protein
MPKLEKTIKQLLEENDYNYIGCNMWSNGETVVCSSNFRGDNYRVHKINNYIQMCLKQNTSVYLHNIRNHIVKKFTSDDELLYVGEPKDFIAYFRKNRIDDILDSI